MPIRGASYNNTSNSGASALNLNNLRSNVNGNIGFFSAYHFNQICKFTDLQQHKQMGKGLVSIPKGKIKTAADADSTPDGGTATAIFATGSKIKGESEHETV